MTCGGADSANIANDENDEEDEDEEGDGGQLDRRKKADCEQKRKVFL